MDCLIARQAEGAPSSAGPLQEDAATESGYPRQRVDEEVPGDGSRRVLKQELLIFAKYPEPGRVKTRLARTVGPVEAARLYRGMVETVVKKTTPVNGEYHQTMYFDPPERVREFKQWFPLQMKKQCSGDLGHRMLDAFQMSFANGSERVVVIGTDCTEIDRALLCDAFQKLETADLILGPAKDGGYYLIGMKATHPLLFEEISWSTTKVLQETLHKAKEGGLKVTLLPLLADIDEG